MEDSKSDQNSATEPKRTKRDRKKVSLLSSEYSTIYDDANNRKKDPSLKKKKDKRDKKETPTGKSKKDGNVKMSSTTFQWIGDGAAGTQDGEKDRLYYSKLEINVGNHPALIQIGDDILLSSYDTAEADVFDKTVLVHRSIDVNNSKDADRSNVAMNELKPFVGKVVSMWEEGAANAKPSVGNSGKNCIVKHNDSRRGKMKALFQWYYKKEDVANLRGQFDGISRQTILSHLTERDLLLGKTIDENEVSTILGKCHVSRQKPDLKYNTEKELVATSSSSSKRSREGSFICNFDISIATASKGKGKVTITPYDGPDTSEDAPPSKRSRTSSFVESDDTGTIDTASFMATESMDDAPSINANNSNDDVDDESSLEENEKESIANKAPTTEGSATQKIMVGEKHQAVIPPITAKKVASERNAPTVVWKPSAIPDKKLDKFIEDAGGILKSYMKKKNIEFDRDVPLNLDPKHLPSKFTCREFNMDQILKLLHDKAYDADAALNAIEVSPQMFLFIWTKEEKEMYDAGFKRHFSAIRFITKGISSDKKHMDVVDYHYRFKIPDQFRRYQDKKREQARRMLDCIEKQKMDEYISSETSQAASNATNGSKRIQSWSRTGGGGAHTIGNVEARRHGAKEFLVKVKDTVGAANYLKLVDHLKGLQGRVITIPQCREAFQSQLHDHPELMNCFDEFLPKKFGGTGS